MRLGRIKGWQNEPMVKGDGTAVRKLRTLFELQPKATVV
jgi:hypothetical protein